MLNEISVPLIKLTQDVTFFLNAGEQSPVWEFKPLQEPYPTQYIRKVSNHECEIALRIESYGAQKGRIEVHGNFHLANAKEPSQPEFFDVRGYGAERIELPSITIAGTKTPEQIAKEIKRRFLPAYFPLFNKASAQRDAQRDYRSKQLARMEELAPVVNASLSRAKEQGRDSFDFHISDCYGDVSVYSDGANLKLSSVPFDKAKRILQIIAE